MCLKLEKTPQVLKQPKEFWKAFNFTFSKLQTIHNHQHVEQSSKLIRSKKCFADRFGYQVFATKKKVERYVRELRRVNPEAKFTWRKVIAPRGAKVIRGQIRTNFIFEGEEAFRVSSYRLSSFFPSLKESS